MPTSTILFICTGNVYRSRFAEALFNHHAAERGLSWNAFSRGLEIWQAGGMVLSPHTREALDQRGIPLHRTAEGNASVTEDDLHRADQRIALSREEHHPMVIEQFPEWLDRFTFWEIEDLHLWDADRALTGIERQVLGLLDEIAGE